MTATINGVMVTGTPAEIAELIRLTKQPSLGSYPSTVPMIPITPINPYIVGGVRVPGGNIVYYSAGGTTL